MILLQKAGAEPSKHSHDPQLIFAVCITGTGIKYDLFDSSFAAYSSSSFISAPEIAVDNDGVDSLSIIQVLVPYESRYYFFDRLFHQRAKGRVFAVCPFAFLKNSQETMLGVEVGPGFRVVVGLFCVAAASCT